MQTYLCRKSLAIAIGAISAATCFSATASSHREAPFIGGQPRVDTTDFYMFRSYAAGRQDYVTLIANYMPFQDPQGGPNFYQFDANALYEIHVVNDGGSKENISFQFRFKNTNKRTALPIGGKQILIPLINSGVVSGVNPATLNVRETYTVKIKRGDRRVVHPNDGVLTNLAGGAAEFDKPVDNIGDKSFGSATAYETYANQHIYDVAIPGCGNGRVFVGQRKESFAIAVGKIFDLFNLDPLGSETTGKNDLELKNISSIALEVPTACLTTATEKIIGGFATASVRQGRLIDRSPASGNNNAVKEGGPWAQVSRLGMPLVNEVVIGMDDKDRFNASRPSGDAQFLDYVTNPALPAFVQLLFPTAPAPTNFPRTDLVAAFLTGIQGVNQPANVVASEMLRLNTAVPALPTPQATQNPLGVAAGDPAGFPNGRRPADDVVDLSLRVAMGALCVLPATSAAVGCVPANAPAGGAALTDGVRKLATDFKAEFPYLNTPLPGNN